MERGEGRSGLKARLRRWVGTSTNRQRPRETRTMEERGHDIDQRAAEQLKLSIDSGIGLEPLSRMPTTRPGIEEERSLDSVQPTPILRSTRKRCGVKKSISFSDGQSSTLRWVGTPNLGTLYHLISHNYENNFLFPGTDHSCVLQRDHSWEEGDTRPIFRQKSSFGRRILPVPGLEKDLLLKRS